MLSRPKCFLDPALQKIISSKFLKITSKSLISQHCERRELQNFFAYKKKKEKKIDCAQSMLLDRSVVNKTKINENAKIG